MFGKQQKRKIAIVKFVKIIVESSNAVAIGYAPILRLPSGFLSDFFVKMLKSVRPAVRRCEEFHDQHFAPSVVRLSPPVDGYQ